MLKAQTTLFLIMAAIANHALAASSTIPILATGYLCTLGASCGDSSTPLAISSLDQGQSWSAANLSFGLFSGNVTLNNSACNSTGCTMIGASMGKIMITPIIMRSNATLTSWSTAKISGLPLKNIFSGLTEINCQGDHCLAQGEYVLAPHLFASKPLILDSRNGGQSWNFVALPNSDLLNYQSNAFSCSDNFCVLLGHYNLENKYNDLPVIYTNGNDQNTWSSTEIIKGTPFPYKTASYEISSMSCTGNSCIAIGKYEEDSNLSKHVLSLTSTDRGKSWYFNDALSKVLGDNVNILSNVSCENNTCVVAAYYDYDQPINVAVSHDQGATWSLGYKAEGSKSSHLLVNCNQNTCLVSLDAWNNLAVLTSQDGGYHWNYNIHVLTDENNNIAIRSVGCQANNCFIVGSHTDEEPFILTSHDSGLSWVVNQTISNLPTNISEVSLDGISNAMTDLPTNLSTMLQSKLSHH